jgi:hypothetical protein
MAVCIQYKIKEHTVKGTLAHRRLKRKMDLNFIITLIQSFIRMLLQCFVKEVFGCCAC